MGRGRQDRSAFLSSEAFVGVFLSAAVLLALALPLGLVCLHHVERGETGPACTAGGLAVALAGLSAWGMTHSLQRYRSSPGLHE